MPKISDFAQKRTTNLALTSVSGSGKSTLTSYAPTPSIFLLFDKDTPTLAPGADASNMYYKAYPPAEVEMQNGEYMRPRNVMDTFIKDVQAIRGHFFSIFRGARTPLIMKMMDGSTEEWPTPVSLIVEGAAPIAQHAMNRILTINGKFSIDDFTTKDGKTNKFAAYDTRLQHLLDLYDVLLRLPCNIVVTTWPEEESKSEKVNGKVEITKTGVIKPNFGGKLNELAPGKFDSSLYLKTVNGRYYAHTRNSNYLHGYKVGNQFGLPEILDLTIGNHKLNLYGKPLSKEQERNPCKELWELLVGSA